MTNEECGCVYNSYSDKEDNSTRIPCSKYVYFNKENGWFELTPEAEEIIYREKGIICSYSGATEWCHHTFCEFLDLYSGHSIYNYALGCYEHKKIFKDLYKTEKGKEDVFNWLKEIVNKDWFIKMADSFDCMFDNLPNLNEE